MKLRAYYNKPDQSQNLENPEGVWQDYVGVYHMNPHPAGDSVRARGDNSAAGWQDGVVSGTPADVPATVTYGMDMNGADGNYIGLGSENFPSSALTVQVMVQVDAITGLGDQRLISKAQGTSDADHVLMISTIPISGGGHQWRFRLKVDGTTYTYIRNSAYAGGISADGSTPVWVTFIFDGGEIRDSINGTAPDPSDVIPVSGPVTQNAWPLMIGNQPDGVGGTTSGKAIDGKISEVRVSSAARDPSWVVTEYRMLTNPASVEITYGDEVDLSGTDLQSATTGESVVFGETLNVAVITAESLSESLVLQDDTIEPGFSSASPSESLVLKDTLSVVQRSRQRLEESLVLGEQIFSIRDRRRVSLDESLVFSDSLTLPITQEGEDESLAFGETLLVRDEYTTEEGESLKLSEPLSVVQIGEAVTEPGVVRSVGWKRVWWVAQARRITEFD